MSDVQNALGATLQVATAQAGPFTTVAEVRDFKAPGFESAIRDVSNHSNVNGFEELLPSGLTRLPPFTFKVNFLAADPGQQILRAAALSKAKLHFKTILEGARKTWAYAGFVTADTGVDLPVDGEESEDFTVKPSDYMTIT